FTLSFFSLTSSVFSFKSFSTSSFFSLASSVLFFRSSAILFVNSLASATFSSTVSFTFSETSFDLATISSLVSSPDLGANNTPANAPIAVPIAVPVASFFATSILCFLLYSLLFSSIILPNIINLPFDKFYFKHPLTCILSTPKVYKQSYIYIILLLFNIFLYYIIYILLKYDFIYK